MFLGGEASAGNTDTEGPVTTNVIVSPSPAAAAPAVTASVRDRNSTVAAAEFFVDNCGTAGTGNSMLASDGTFDEQTEAVNDTLAAEFVGLSQGTHTVFVRGRDSQNNWGACASTTFVKDTVPPNVVSSTRNDPNPTNATTVSWTVTFTEPVFNVDNADFNLQSTLTATGTVQSVSGSGTTRTVAASGVAGTGTLRLRLIDNNTITDLAGNPLGGAGVQSFTTGEFYSIDNSDPTSTITFPVNAATYGFSSWNAGCTDSTPDMCGTSSDAGAAGVATVNATIQQGSGNYWGGSAFDSATPVLIAATGTTNWTIPFAFTNFDQSGSYTVLVSAIDAVGNEENTAVSTFTIDATPPTVVAINRANPSPTNNSSVGWNVLFSESVTGVDAGDFVLQMNGTVTANFGTVMGSGSSYTVTATGITGTGMLRLNLDDDDSIFDANTNPLGGPGMGNGSFTGQAYTIDRDPPTVLSISRADADPTNAQIVSWTVTFSEDVMGVDVADFSTADGGGLSGSFVTGVSGSGATRAVTGNTGTGSGTLGLNLIDNNSIRDSVNNPLGGGGAQNFVGDIYTIDKDAPTSTITFPTPGGTYNAAGWNAGCTPSGSCGTASDSGGSNLNRVEVSLKQNSTGMYWNGTAFNSGELFIAANGTTNWNFPFSASNFLADGSYTVQSRAIDNATNQEFPGPTVTFTIDTTPPTVLSINRDNASPTNAQSVSWTVTFSEPVGGVDATDFALVQGGGLSGASITSVNPPGPAAVYTVLADTGSGSGTLGLDLVDNDSITDAATNPLGGPGAGNGNFTGQVYVIDKDNPTSTITFPEQGGIYNDPLWNAGCSTPGGDACGTASDTGGSGLNREEVSVRRLSNNMYWNGSSFLSATELFFPATGTTSWTFAFAAANFPATGQYTLHARAVDNATNVETPGPSVTFTFGKCPAGSPNNAPIITGTNGADTICAGPASQTIYGLGGADLIFASSGDDVVRAGDGNDTVLGEAGNDALYGEAGFDNLFGGPGTDVCYTQAGGGIRTTCEAGV